MKVRGLVASLTRAVKPLDDVLNLESSQGDMTDGLVFVLSFVMCRSLVVQKKGGYEIRRYSTNQTAFFTAAYVGSSDFTTAVKVMLLIACLQKSHRHVADAVLIQSIAI